MARVARLAAHLVARHGSLDGVCMQISYDYFWSRPACFDILLHAPVRRASPLDIGLLSRACTLWCSRTRVGVEFDRSARRWHRLGRQHAALLACCSRSVMSMSLLMKLHVSTRSWNRIFYISSITPVSLYVQSASLVKTLLNVALSPAAFLDCWSSWSAATILHIRSGCSQQKSCRHTDISGSIYNI
jgi:hypothetical protein